MKTLAFCFVLGAGVAHAQGYSSPGCGQGALDGNCNLIVPPITSLALSADKTRVIGSTAAGALDPGAPNLIGDVSGTTAATVAPSLRPAYTTVSVSSGGTVQLPSGFTYYDLSGSGAVSTATIKLPASPVDRQLVRLIALGTLAVTTMTIQDANGNSVGSTVSLPLLGAAQYQYQATQWVRSGS